MKSLNKKVVATTFRDPGRTVNSKVLEKIKPSGSMNFSITDQVDFEESEIRITVKGNNVVAKFFLKGVPITEQVILVKPKPTPPPLNPQDIIKAIRRIRLNIFLNT